jgi:DNA ligase (NAD+)
VNDTSLNTFETEADYLDALALARRAAETYYLGEPVIIDDASYDELARRIALTEDTHPDWQSAETVTGKVAGGVELAGEVHHARPMLSLENCFSADELTDWYQRLTRALGREPGPLVVEPKLDGLAISATYRAGNLERIATRGDGERGEDVTGTIARIAGLPERLNEPVDLEVRGEVMMTDADFSAANTIRAGHGEAALVNPRNGAAGALRAKEKPYRLPLTFFAYDAPELGINHAETIERLGALGIHTAAASTAGVARCADVTQAQQHIVDLGARRASLGFAIDGAVVKVDRLADRDAGATAKAPRWAVAYKYPPDMRLTRLVGIELQLGRTGAVTPVGKLEPVFVGGTTIQSVTLHNAEEIARKDLRIGDMVWVRRAGEVIPEIVGVAVEQRPDGLEPWQAPSACPRCGSTLDTTAKVWRCPDGRGCGNVELLVHAAGRGGLDIDGLGREVVEAAVDAGLITDVGDLYTLTAGALAELTLSGRRLGESAAQRIEAGCITARSHPLHRHLVALGIRHLGTKMARQLAAAINDMTALQAAGVQELETIDGFGHERAERVITDLAAVGPVVEKMRAAGVNLTEPETGARTAGPLDGRTVVVTGTVDGWTRGSLEELIRTLGGKPSGSVSKTTGLVVVGDNAGSKAAKAVDLGVATVSAATFLAEHQRDAQ